MMHVSPGMPPDGIAGSSCCAVVWPAICIFGCFTLRLGLSLMGCFWRRGLRVAQVMNISCVSPVQVKMPENQL